MKIVWTDTVPVEPSYEEQLINAADGMSFDLSGHDQIEIRSAAKLAGVVIRIQSGRCWVMSKIKKDENRITEYMKRRGGSVSRKRLATNLHLTARQIDSLVELGLLKSDGKRPETMSI